MQEFAVGAGGGEAESFAPGALGRGVLAAAISALFLAAGMFFRKQARRGDKL